MQFLLTVGAVGENVRSQTNPFTSLDLSPTRSGGKTGTSKMGLYLLEPPPLTASLGESLTAQTNAP
jgi:hypothetical protein